MLSEVSLNNMKLSFLQIKKMVKYWHLWFSIALGVCERMCGQSLQSCLTLCDPMDGSPPDSSVHGIFQARRLEWAALLSSRGSSDPGIKPVSLMSPALAGTFFYH